MAMKKNKNNIEEEGSTCNTFNWVANAECHGFTHIDPLESTIEAAGIGN
jgi:hypothetical protein